MQPTYWPWIGYFDLIARSDVFVFYDTVQFVRQSWQQRNRIRTAQGWQWLTVPVLHDFGQSIHDVRIEPTGHWRHKHRVSLATSYGRAPYWERCAPFLDELYARPWERLADLNVHVIRWAAEQLGLSPRFLRSSEMDPLPGTKIEPLVELCRRLGATTYLSPVASRAYIADDQAFRDAGIELEFHSYEHPTWPQVHGAFVSHMGVIDLLANVGDAAGALVRSSSGAPSPAPAARGDPP